MLKSDSNFVPVKYVVMEATVGAGSANLWLKVASYGMDTETNYDAYVNSIKDASWDGRPPAGLQGTLGEYSVAALADVEQYSSKKSFHDGRFEIG